MAESPDTAALIAEHTALTKRLNAVSSARRRCTAAQARADNLRDRYARAVAALEEEQSKLATAEDDQPPPAEVKAHEKRMKAAFPSPPG